VHIHKALGITTEGRTLPELTHWLNHRTQEEGTADWSVDPVDIEEKDSRTKRIPKKYLRNARYILFNWLLGYKWSRREDNLLHWNHTGEIVGEGFNHVFQNRGLGSKDITDLLDIQRASPYNFIPNGATEGYRTESYFEHLIIHYWKQGNLEQLKTIYIINGSGEYETIFDWATRTGILDKPFYVAPPVTFRNKKAERAERKAEPVKPNQFTDFDPEDLEII
jgi:hypothetical protein